MTQRYQKERLEYLKSSLMIPDWHFVKQARRWQFPEERFEIYFNKVMKTWEIWRFSIDGTLMPCLLFSAPSLDQRLILKLEMRWFIHTSKSASQLFSQLESYEAKQKELSERAFDKQLDEISHDHGDSWRGVIKKQVPRTYEVK